LLTVPTVGVLAFMSLLLLQIRGYVFPPTVRGSLFQTARMVAEDNCAVDSVTTDVNSPTSIGTV